MIDEVDDALSGLIRAEVLPGGDVEVVLDAPTKDWAARRNTPTIDMYLYDLREDLRRRQRGRVDQRGPDGTTTARCHPPRYVKLSYLITAWTQRPEDEHQLLSLILRRLMAYDALPQSRLTGSLAELGLPVAMTVALPPPEDRSFADVWTALGGELKPSLDVVVSAPLLVGTEIVTGPPVTEGLQVTAVDLLPDSRLTDGAGHLVRSDPTRVSMRRRNPL